MAGYASKAGVQVPEASPTSPSSASRPGMLNDIWETPQVMRAVLEKSLKDNGEEPVVIPDLSVPFPSTHKKFPGKTALEVMADCRPNGSVKNKITIIGCGTSYHVAVLAEYLIEHIARVPVEVTYASEYRYKNLLHRKGDVLIAVSSSGETVDTVESLRHLNNSPVGAGVLTVAVVNDGQQKDDTSLGRESDVRISTHGGSEVGIAATKVFSASALAFVLLAIAMGHKSGTFQGSDLSDLIGKLKKIPDQIQQVLDTEALPMRPKADGKAPNLKIGECPLWDIGLQNVLANNFIFLGRGFNFPIALEGAMKCKEVAYIHAEGYPAAEMKHGPIALIDQFMPVVFIAPRSDTTCYEKICANIEEVKTRNGSVIAITEEHKDGKGKEVELEQMCEHVIKMPETHEYLVPLIAAIPMQLLAYMMGILRGHDVDNPRFLSKVTM